jgi:hypothetical protein
MKTNLTTEQGRKSAIEQIEKEFINSLRDIGVELSEEVSCEICSNCVDLCHSDSGMSQITIWSLKSENTIKNKITFGSSGSFAPENKEPYWRTIHAASILKNWDKVCESVNEHCKRYSELVEEIKKQNPN